LLCDALIDAITTRARAYFGDFNERDRERKLLVMPLARNNILSAAKRCVQGSLHKIKVITDRDFSSLLLETNFERGALSHCENGFSSFMRWCEQPISASKSPHPEHPQALHPNVRFAPGTGPVTHTMVEESTRQADDLVLDAAL
jgi:hypothetical protein